MNSEALIKKHEGLVLVPYRDTEGILTVGYGQNIERGITENIANAMFADSMVGVRSDCLIFSWFHKLSPVRQAVIENMLFNLGLRRFKGFEKTIEFIEAGDFFAASIEMLNSKWARQVGYRANELSQMMKTNEWGKK